MAEEGCLRNAQFSSIVCHENIIVKTINSKPAPGSGAGLDEAQRLNTGDTPMPLDADHLPLIKIDVGSRANTDDLVLPFVDIQCAAGVDASAAPYSQPLLSITDDRLAAGPSSTTDNTRRKALKISGSSGTDVDLGVGDCSCGKLNITGTNTSDEMEASIEFNHDTVGDKWVSLTVTGSANGSAGTTTADATSGHAGTLLSITSGSGGSGGAAGAGGSGGAAPEGSGGPGGEIQIISGAGGTGLVEGASGSIILGFQEHGTTGAAGALNNVPLIQIVPVAKQTEAGRLAATTAGTITIGRHETGGDSNSRYHADLHIFGDLNFPQSIGHIGTDGAPNWITTMGLQVNSSLQFEYIQADAVAGVAASVNGLQQLNLANLQAAKGTAITQATGDFFSDMGLVNAGLGATAAGNVPFGHIFAGPGGVLMVRLP